MRLAAKQGQSRRFVLINYLIITGPSLRRTGKQITAGG